MRLCAPCRCWDWHRCAMQAPSEAHLRGLHVLCDLHLCAMQAHRDAHLNMMQASSDLHLFAMQALQYALL